MANRKETQNHQQESKKPENKPPNYFQGGLPCPNAAQFMQDRFTSYSIARI